MRYSVMVWWCVCRCLCCAVHVGLRVLYVLVHQPAVEHHVQSSKTNCEIVDHRPAASSSSSSSSTCTASHHPPPSPHYVFVRACMREHQCTSSRSTPGQGHVRHVLWVSHVPCFVGVPCVITHVCHVPCVMYSCTNVCHVYHVHHELC